jgi:Fe-S-cluster containining protein
LTRAKSDKWYAKGLQFACTSCGLCCKGPDPGWVIVDEVDILRLLEATGLEIKEFGRKYLRQVTVDGKRVLSLVEKRNHDCVFWEDSVGCQVYMDRPQQCRSWPFWPENLKTKVAWEGASWCPGLDKGKRYTFKEIERMLGGKRGTLRGTKPRRHLPVAE